VIDWSELHPGEYEVVDLPPGSNRISGWTVDSTSTRELVETVDGPLDVVYQRLPDGAEIPS
jgi:hypothetical protein